MGRQRIEATHHDVKQPLVSRAIGKRLVTRRQDMSVDAPAERPEQRGLGGVGLEQRGERQAGPLGDRLKRYVAPAALRGKSQRGLDRVLAGAGFLGSRRHSRPMLGRSADAVKPLSARARASDASRRRPRGP